MTVFDVWAFERLGRNCMGDLGAPRATDLQRAMATGRAELSDFLSSLGPEDYDEQLRAEDRAQRSSVLQQVLGVDSSALGSGSPGSAAGRPQQPSSSWWAPSPSSQLEFSASSSSFLRAWNIDGSDIEDATWEPLPYPRAAPPTASGARAHTLATLKAAELRRALESEGKALARTRLPAARIASPVSHVRQQPPGRLASHNPLIQAIRAEDHAEIWRLASERPQLLSQPDSEGWSAMHWVALQLAHAQARSSGNENERLRQALHRERAETARLANELREKDAELLAMQQRLGDQGLKQEQHTATGDEA